MPGLGDLEWEWDADLDWSSEVLDKFFPKGDEWFAEMNAKYAGDDGDGDVNEDADGKKKNLQTMQGKQRIMIQQRTAIEPADAICS